MSIRWTGQQCGMCGSHSALRRKDIPVLATTGMSKEQIGPASTLMGHRGQSGMDTASRKVKGWELAAHRDKATFGAGDKGGGVTSRCPGACQICRERWHKVHLTLHIFYHNEGKQQLPVDSKNECPWQS